MPRHNLQNEYVSQRILTASPLELIRLLYEGALQALNEASAALESGDIFTRGRAVSKAVEILGELRIALRRDIQEEYTNTLGELYGYMQHQLIRAHREKSGRLLTEVAGLLKTLLDGWVGAMSNLATTRDDEPSQAPDQKAETINALNPYLPAPADSSAACRSWQV